jgi:putative tricarboxylic transport membrane protein
MDLVLDYIARGALDVVVDGAGVLDPTPLLMVFGGLMLGIAVGATPGLSGPFAMAIALPILISSFGHDNDALLPILGCLIGLMKGATVGGAVPAILFNTPGTPDALMTTLDGHPMAKQGRARKALRIAHFSSVMGDSLSDIALFLAAPLLAIAIERVLDLPEKAALIILSLCFMAAVVGDAPLKGFIGGLLGMLLALIGSTTSGDGPRMTFGVPELGGGLPLTSAVLGVLVLSEILIALQALVTRGSAAGIREAPAARGDQTLPWREKRKLMPTILRSAGIGTIVGALPGIGTTLAATLSYDVARRVSRTPEAFSKGSVEGLSATEAANSAVSGANLIPVMSIGIPGNFAALFLILAIESVGDFTLGPQVFRFTEIREIDGFGLIINRDLVVAFSIFTMMAAANLVNWTIGGVFLRSLGVLARVPAVYMMPLILLVTVTAAYAQDGGFVAVWTMLVFALIGYVFRRLGVSLLPFVIGFILAPQLETVVRGGFTASGGDPLFLVKSPIALAFLTLAGLLIVYGGRRRAGVETQT